MNIKTYLIALTILSIFSSCNSNKKELIIGDWNAVSFVQEDSTYQFDLSRVKLSFDEHGNYCYQSNLKHNECGQYKIHKEYLILSDTLNTNSATKNLIFEFLSEDSLNIKMNQDSLDQKLLFTKEGF